jgi:hypothetical protein
LEEAVAYATQLGAGPTNQNVRCNDVVYLLIRLERIFKLFSTERNSAEY